MKSKFVKIITLGLISTSMIIGMLGCGTEGSSSSSTNSSSSTDTESSSSSSKETASSSASTGDTETTKSSNGKLSAEGLPLFEKLYESDAQKEFKINFAKESLAEFDKVEEVIPKALKDTLSTSKNLVKFDGPRYKYSFQTSGSKENRSKTDNLYGVLGEVSFNDSKEFLEASRTLTITFRTGSDTEIKFDEDTKKLLSSGIPDAKPDELEAKINESFKNKGKAIYLIEEKNKKLTISSTIAGSANYAQIDYVISKDYPQ